MGCQLQNTIHVQATVQYACKCVGSLNKAKHRYQLVTEGMWEKINGQVVSARPTTSQANVQGSVLKEII